MSRLLRVGATLAASRCTLVICLKSYLLGSFTAATFKLIHYFLASSVVAIEATSLNFCF